MVPRLRTCTSPIARRLRQQRAFFLRQSRAFYLVVCGERADDELVILLANPAKAGNLAYIDEQLGIGEPEFHERQQAVPACQELRLFAMSGQSAHGLV
jgi:hypothetical protein